MSDFNVQISRLVNDFVAQVSALAREAALGALEGALSDAMPANGARTRAGAGPSLKVSLPRLPKGAKRPAEQIAIIKARLHDYILANPGQRVEQINKGLGTTTKDLALPIKKLIAEGAVKAEGEKRATSYFAGSATPTSSGAKKARRKRKAA